MKPLQLTLAATAALGLAYAAGSNGGRQDALRIDREASVHLEKGTDYYAVAGWRATESLGPRQDESGSFMGRTAPEDCHIRQAFDDPGPGTQENWLARSKAYQALHTATLPPSLGWDGWASLSKVDDKATPSTVPKWLPSEAATLHMIDTEQASRLCNASLSAMTPVHLLRGHQVVTTSYLGFPLLGGMVEGQVMDDLGYPAGTFHW